jgi:predicted membrane-bound spermidine synthase
VSAVVLALLSLLALTGIVATPWHGLASPPTWIDAPRWAGLLGAAGLLVAARHAGDRALSAALAIALGGLASSGLLDLVTALRPVTFDALAQRVDAGAGLSPSFLFGRVLELVPAFRAVTEAGYALVPLGVAVLCAIELRAERRAATELATAFVGAMLAAHAIHALVPIAGPANAFIAEFPWTAPLSTDTPTMIATGARGGLPPVGVVWAVLLVWRARRHGPALHALACAWLALAAVGALGTGRDYGVGLVVAPLLALGVRAATEPAAWSARRKALVVSVLGSTLWIALIRTGTTLGLATWLLALITVVAAFVLERRIINGGAASKIPSEADVPAQRASPIACTALAVAALFFASGFSGLLYEVVFAKSLALTFGSTSTASTTVLATYMVGMALGSWLGGQLPARWAPLRVYAVAEIGIGVACAASPFLLGIVRDLYIATATGMDPGRPLLTALRVGYGSLVLLPPTLLMGITLPILARWLSALGASVGNAVGLLYGANTLGAALSALLTGYFILPELGVARTTWLAVATNVCVGLGALLMSRRGLPAAPSAGDTQPLTATHVDARLEGLGLAVLGVGGVVTLALEVTYVHLLAVVAGNSAYAFSLMLFCFLVGLGAGSFVARRVLAAGADPARSLAFAELGLTASVLLGVFLWTGIPDYFAGFERYPLARGFAARELVRGLICALAMIPPACFIGAAYPLAMDAVARARRSGVSAIQAISRGAAINTIGNVMGALLAGFVLLPRLGSLRSLHVLAAAAFGLAALAALTSRQRRLRTSIPAAAAVALLAAAQPAHFDYARLASGANVYFARGWRGVVIDHAESLDGGLTSVGKSILPDGTPLHTLLTNGKFQGNDSLDGEMRAQFGFALYPLLHTAARERALVIGYGTGGSARAIHDAGFKDTHIVELSRDILDLGHRHFARANGEVLRQPGVRTTVSDGRNVLLLDRDRYDLISMEIASIWFAGAATLYSAEFYELARSRLTERGVLQQWVQLHHLSRADLVLILGTLRSRFSHVWLYAAEQGVLVACEHDCAPTHDTLRQLNGRASLAFEFAVLGGDAARLLRDRLLTPEDVDRLLTSPEARALGGQVSTDDNLLLEYRTPRGNARDSAKSLTDNLTFLNTYATRDPLEGTRLREN